MQSYGAHEVTHAGPNSSQSHLNCFGEQTAQACANAFHEKAGRSQGDSFWYLLVMLFLPSRVATVGTLPSALFAERFLFARGKWGVLVSAGAAT
jgi:hypothetical protein